MRSNPTPRPRRLGLAALALAAAAGSPLPSVAASSSFDLRDLTVFRNWVPGQDPFTASEGFQDLFNNGDLLDGPAFTGGLGKRTPAYSISGNAAYTTETLPGDISVPGGPEIGQFRFSQANGTAPQQIVVNGVSLWDVNHRIRLNSPPAANYDTADKFFFNKGLTNFYGSAAYEFVVPQAGERYGARFTDASGSTDPALFNGPAFNDVISLDIVRGGNDGSPFAQMRRISGDGLGSISITGTQNLSVASVIAGSGYTQADIAIVIFEMFWFSDTAKVEGRVAFLGKDADNAPFLIADRFFANTYTIFNGEDVTRFQTGASWSVPAPVPEPGTYALMATGLLALGWASRRRRPDR